MNWIYLFDANLDNSTQKTERFLLKIGFYEIIISKFDISIHSMHLKMNKHLYYCEINNLKVFYCQFRNNKD
jgi:hypothetical protein